MCRNIKTLFNFEPPATQDEVHAAALQFVRKVSGSTNPSIANAEAFNQAVIDVENVVARLLESMTTSAAPKNRELETAKAKARSQQRFRNAN